METVGCPSSLGAVARDVSVWFPVSLALVVLSQPACRLSKQLARHAPAAFGMVDPAAATSSHR